MSEKCGGRSKPPFFRKSPHSGSLRNLPLRHPASVRDPVARMHDDLVAGGEAGQDLGYAVVPMTDPDWDRPGAPVLNGENGPLLTLPEQRAHWHAHGIGRVPGGDVNDDAVVVTERRP